MQRSLIGIVLVFSLFGAAGGEAAAGIYKWTDAQGRVHYGEKAPGRVQSEPVEIRRGPAAPDPILQRQRERQNKLLDVMEQERLEREQRAVEEKRKQAERSKRCNEARDLLQNYKTAGGIYDLDNRGNRVFLDKQAHRAEIARAQAAVNHWCQ
jgi:hypothetical protein